VFSWLFWPFLEPFMLVFPMLSAARYQQAEAHMAVVCARLEADEEAAVPSHAHAHADTAGMVRHCGRSLVVHGACMVYCDSRLCVSLWMA
jgi:hypothetical protein